MDEVNKAVATLEKELNKKFGDDANPLLVSVRSGAAVSMPGMMNTILEPGPERQVDRRTWPRRLATNDLPMTPIAV